MYWQGSLEDLCTHSQHIIQELLIFLMPFLMIRAWAASVASALRFQTHVQEYAIGTIITQTIDVRNVQLFVDVDVAKMDHAN